MAGRKLHQAISSVQCIALFLTSFALPASEIKAKPDSQSGVVHMIHLALLLLIIVTNNAFGIDPDEVRSAYKLLNLEITANKKDIDNHYRHAISSDGNIFSLTGENLKFKEARNLILTFVENFDISILTDSNPSYIAKIEMNEWGANKEERFMRLIEDNKNRLKFAFTAVYSDGGLDDDSFGRPRRSREVTYPAYHEIMGHYKEMLSVDLSTVDIRVYRDLLDIQIQTKSSFITILKDFYPTLNETERETFSIFTSIIADEGTRYDLAADRRMSYFDGRFKEAKKIALELSESELLAIKKIYKHIPLARNGIDNYLAPFYFDTLLVATSSNNSLKLKALAPKELSAKFFLFYGTIAPILSQELTPKQEEAFFKLAFGLSTKLRKELPANLSEVAKAFTEEKERFSLIIDLVKNLDESESQKLFRASIKELNEIKNSKRSCVELASAIIR